MNGSDVSSYIGTSGEAYYIELRFGTDGKKITVIEYDEGKNSADESTYSVNETAKTITIADDKGDTPIFTYSSDYKTLTAAIDEVREHIFLTLTRKE